MIKTSAGFKPSPFSAADVGDDDPQGGTSEIPVQMRRLLADKHAVLLTRPSATAPARVHAYTLALVTKVPGRVWARYLTAAPLNEATAINND